MRAELPWERASEADARYVAWRAWCTGAEAEAPGAPWRKLRPAPLRLLRRALQPEAARRATLDELLRDPWLSPPPPGQCPPRPARRSVAAPPRARLRLRY